MSEKTENSVLRRKAQLGQEQFKARAMTAARALRITLSKVAEDEMGLALAAIGLTEARCPAQTVLPAFDDTTLLLLLDSPGRGPGVALMDASLACALVQQLTMGRVSELRENQPLRKPTRTDAALVAPLLDSLFARAGPLPDTTTEMQILSGLRFGADIANTRLLAMSLEADEYAHFSITVDIACGMRQGKLDLLLPIPDVRAEAPDAAAGEDATPPATLEPVVMSLNAQLRVALCRMRMPFSDLAELKPGDTLPLPDGVLDNAEILTVAGRKVANGKLGQIDGLRAIRLESNGAQGEAPSRRAAGHDMESSDLRPPAGPSDFDTFAADAQDVSQYDLPDLPDVTAAEQSHLPDLPELPDLPDLPDGSGDGAFGLSDLPDLPDLPELPDLPDLPGEASGPGDLPDLPELPDLPDLPDLPMAKQA